LPGVETRAEGERDRDPHDEQEGWEDEVGVQPCQSAWNSGGYTARQVPGLLTRTIAATVRPRSASRESKRSATSTA
jgi:hypothetical protein